MNRQALCGSAVIFNLMVCFLPLILNWTLPDPDNYETLRAAITSKEIFGTHLVSFILAAGNLLNQFWECTFYNTQTNQVIFTQASINASMILMELIFIAINSYNGNEVLFICIYMGRYLILSYSGIFYLGRDKFFQNRSFVSFMVLDCWIHAFTVLYPFSGSYALIFKFILFGLSVLLVCVFINYFVLMYLKDQWCNFIMKGVAIPVAMKSVDYSIIGTFIVCGTYFITNFCYGIPSFNQMDKRFLIILDIGFIIQLLVLPRNEALIVHDARKVSELMLRYISHEMRTPLNTILVGLRLLNDKIVRLEEPVPEDIFQIISDSRLSCELARNKLNDILAQDKLNHGLYDIEKEEISSTEFLTTALAPFYLQAREKDVRLNLSNISSMSHVMLMVDKHKLGIVIGNLVSNSIKFSPANGSVDISMEYIAGKASSGKSGAVVIAVKDTGPGLTQEEMSQLFTSVVQFQPGKLQSGGGSGFGLCISKGIADLHNAALSVRSAGAGQGCTFSLTIPTANAFVSASIPSPSPLRNGKGPVVELARLCRLVSGWSSSIVHPTTTASPNPNDTAHVAVPHRLPPTPASDAEATLASATAPPQATASSDVDSPIAAADVSSSSAVTMASGSGELQRSLGPARTPKCFSRILIAEDSALARKMLVRLVEERCDEVVEAEDGLVAMCKFQENLALGLHFDLIMLDFQMPNMNGPSVAKAIRKVGYTGVIVGVTGNALTKDIQEFRGSGANHVFLKPLDVEEFDRKSSEWHRNGLVCVTGALASNTTGDLRVTDF